MRLPGGDRSNDPAGAACIVGKEFAVAFAAAIDSACTPGSSGRIGLLSLLQPSSVTTAANRIVMAAETAAFITGEATRRASSADSPRACCKALIWP